jgi:hypothetical protein
VKGLATHTGYERDRARGVPTIRMILKSLILVSIGLCAVVGCAAEEGGCPKVVGQFHPLYKQMSGTCGSITDSQPLVKIDDGPQGAQTSILMFGNGRLTTEVVVRGCSVQMKQQFETDARVQSYLEALELSVESENELAGQVSMSRYGADGTVSCSGVYEAHLTKETVAVGTAVGAAAGTP